MSISHSRIDKFIADHCKIGKRAARLMIAQRRIKVDDSVINDNTQIVHRFSNIALDGKLIQNNTPVYIMLYKPTGVVCATKDDKHQTVIHLLKPQFDKALCDELHIVGRLDLNTSGLVLLTNDSRWSSLVTSPVNKIPKCYRVTVNNPITPKYIDAFTQGIYFPYENITTRPAILNIINDYTALITLVEGRYHQIKRMFGYFRNAVKVLHRLSVGNIELDNTLLSGESRLLTQSEIDSIFNAKQ